MIKCNGCGRDLEKNANFCSYCGFRTDKGIKNGIKTPVDGRASWEKDIQVALDSATESLEKAFKIARDSLREVAEELSNELRDYREKWESKRKSSTLDYLVCEKCGTKNDEDAVYCKKCGIKLEI